jgi:DNA recombination protein RmuC
MESMLLGLVLALLIAAVAILGLLLARAGAARLSAERELAAARQRLAEGERRFAEFERLRGESLQAAQAAVLATAQQVSSKLLEDHKRETSEAKKEAEERMRQASAELVKQMSEIARTVQQLHGQVQEKGAAIDTLARALSSPGGAGQLAEIGLANTLKSFGLEPERDFILQFTTQDSETGRRLRPDALVFLPGNAVLVIDCKASKFVLDIAESESAAQDEAYRNLARSMNQHLRALAEKDYEKAVRDGWRQAGRGEEIARIFSVMYLPNEAVLEKIARADGEFIRKAQEKGIIPAGPAALHSLISIASAEIKVLRQIENQNRIVELTQQLLESLSATLGHAAAVGRSIKSAADSFAKLTGSVNQRLLPRARKLAQLGLQPRRDLPANLPGYSVHAQEDALIEGEAEVVDEEAPPSPRLVK